MDVIAYQMRCEVYSKPKRNTPKKKNTQWKERETIWRERQKKLNKNSVGNKKEFNFRVAQKYNCFVAFNCKCNRILFLFAPHYTRRILIFIAEPDCCCCYDFISFVRCSNRKTKLLFVDFILLPFWIICSSRFFVVVVSNTPIACILQPKFV